ncbi:MAG: HAMP domain-containing protein [Planctomycetota bacterium]|nr:HAMP domain-containing protein [Planctomycetota bacterium]
MKFRRFQTRILVLFIGLFIPVQVFTFTSVNTANIKNAVTQIEKELDVAGTVFTKLIDIRQSQLTTNARLLSDDFAFKEAVASEDLRTIFSVVDNHRRRMGADMMMLAADKDELPILANTLRHAEKDQSFPFPELVDEIYNENKRSAAALKLIDGVPYFLVVTPLLAPEPIAWLCPGFVIDDALARELKDITDTQVTFITGSDGKHEIQATTLAQSHRPSLLKIAGERTDSKSRIVEMQGERLVTLQFNVGKEEQVAVVLQRSLEEKLAPYHSLRLVLGLLSIGGMFLLVIGASIVARSVSKPVQALVEGARRIGKGDYKSEVEVTQSDEIGELAIAFNEMTRGLAEKDRVRDLLGKVVSTAVAEELLKNQDVKLGGEDLEVSILFSDIRSFTSLSESKMPGEILEFLNYYLTHMSEAIEAQDGIVDKYIGDAIMALFGAPVEQPDAADRAIKSALAMRDALVEVNREFKKRGWEEIRTGIGINTDIVVAGNMGSPNRLNYTVIGDGVNLASRLEGLTKEYGVQIIVSEATLLRAQGKYKTRSLGEVAVRGRIQPTLIFELLGIED